MLVSDLFVLFDDIRGMIMNVLNIKFFMLFFKFFSLSLKQYTKVVPININVRMWS